MFGEGEVAEEETAQIVARLILESASFPKLNFGARGFSFPLNVASSGIIIPPQCSISSG
jgi:hypothetical protein